ncbi:MAG: hypothetical protein GY861_25750 [bacterium]|nr:hypothetical protein [bacterium]
MDGMTKNQFKRKWTDTHTELSALDRLEGGRRSLIVDSPGDKGIYSSGKIKGKNILEKQGFKDRDDKFKEMILDAVDVNAEKLASPKNFNETVKLARLAADLMNHKKEANVEVNFTFADMVKQATIDKKKYNTVDVEAKGEHGPS